MKRKPNIAENELVILLKNKNHRGYSILYENYSKTLYNIIYKVVQSKETSTDLLQDTFVKIWNNIDRYNPSKGCLYTWMLNITRNLAIDKIRSVAYLQTTKNVFLEDYISKIDEQYHFEADFDGTGLQKIIERLPPNQKHVIDLVYYKGYTQMEVSQKFEIPIGTVKSRIKIAISQLRRMIA
jgi:RNA polymerase sigma-70 factor, ECF subfamily